jgi:TM2 domain-containing membrane protein YozV
MIGIHRFYMGKIGTGILMLVFTCTYFLSVITGIWLLIDIIIIIAGSPKDGSGRELKW